MTADDPSDDTDDPDAESPGPADDGPAQDDGEPAEGDGGSSPDDGASAPDGGADRRSDAGGPPDGDGAVGGGTDEPDDGDDDYQFDFEGEEPAVDPRRVDELAEELAATHDELDRLESRVEDKTVHRDDLTAELKRYVRARQRRGHATGWGPYIVLLYGTVMTLGAFYYLGGPVVIAAMLVIWLSTLGLFVVMLIVGGFIGAGRKLGGLRDLVGKLRR